MSELTVPGTTKYVLRVSDFLCGAPQMRVCDSLITMIKINQCPINKAAARLVALHKFIFLIIYVEYAVRCVEIKKQ
jgi:hypothetical protein